ncbi:MAG: VanZ family protein [Gemmatimonas sp.]|nr:VanZ family protein [Gemmatimonas sp.]
MALIIAATLLPFGGMAAEQIPPAWCVRCGSLWLTDVISNVAMFVPFGVALELRRWTVWRVAVVSLLFTLGVEALQSVGLPPGRSPALADVMSNTVGGVLGALLVFAWRWQRVASRVQLRVVALGWSAVVCAVVAWSGYMLTPVTRLEAMRTVSASVTPSAFGHVPGHGWYEGTTDSAFVGTTRIKRGWSGPIIQQLAFEQFPMTAGVTVRGTDPLYGQIPLLFVHLPNDSSAWLQLAKHGNDVELTVLRPRINMGAHHASRSCASGLWGAHLLTTRDRWSLPLMSRRPLCDCGPWARTRAPIRLPLRRCWDGRLSSHSSAPTRHSRGGSRRAGCSPSHFRLAGCMHAAAVFGLPWREARQSVDCCLCYRWRSDSPRRVTRTCSSSQGERPWDTWCRGVSLPLPVRLSVS